MAMLLCVSLQFVAAAQQEAKVGILDLGASNFSSAVAAPGARTLVSFYAPWCAHSQKLAPQYESAMKKIHAAREEDATFVGMLARVDAMEHRALASSYGVRGYPTLIWFVDGEPKAYHGALTSDDIVDWVIKRGGPLIASLTDTEAVDRFRLSYTVTMVASAAADPSAMPAADEARAPSAFEEVCRELAEVPVRCGRLLASPSAGAEPPSPSIVLYRAGDDAALTYPGGYQPALGQAAEAAGAEDVAASMAALRKLAVSESLPPVVDYSYESHATIFKSSIELLVFLLEATPSPADASAAADAELATGGYRTSFAAAAQELRGSAIFVRVNARDHGHTIGRYFAADSASPSAPLPLAALGVYSKATRGRYLFNASLSAAALEADVRLVLDGRATPLRRTDGADARLDAAQVAHVAVDAGAATTADAGPAAAATGPAVTTRLTGSGLESAWRMLGGHDPEGGGAPRRPDLVVLFWAPWCATCAAAERDFAELAAVHAGDAGVSFAEVDVSDNELPSALKVRELPSVLLLRANASSAGGQPRAALDDKDRIARCCAPHGSDAAEAAAMDPQSMAAFIAAQRSRASPVASS